MTKNEVREALTSLSKYCEHQRDEARESFAKTRKGEDRAKGTAYAEMNIRLRSLLERLDNDIYHSWNNCD